MNEKYEPKFTKRELALLPYTEWSSPFAKAMRERLIAGALRYGKIGDKRKPKWDRVPDMLRRLQEYQEGGNLEHLVDVANLCMLEFVEGEHPQRHFAALDNSKHTGEK